MSDFAINAFWFGILSASSLLIGSVLSLFWKPPQRVVAALLAFGAGALLSALAFELVDEAVKKAGFWPMAVGAIIGGIAFIILNQILNGKGAFLRKPSTTDRYLRTQKREKAADLLERLSKVEILRSLPPEEMQAILPAVESVSFTAGTRIFEQGDVGDALFLIENGEVDILRKTDPASKQESGAEAADGYSSIAVLGSGDAFGEMALLTGEPRSASAVCKTDIEAYVIQKGDFDRLLKVSPGLTLAVSQLLAKRLDKASQRQVEVEKDRAQWRDVALKNIGPEALAPTRVEVLDAAASHAGGGAPLAIWLGIFLDGIPESIVIGASISATSSVSMALIVGLFLSNFPEALSSSVGMSNIGYSKTKITLMWGSLVILTGIGAAVGNIMFTEMPDVIVAAIEGMAAGAMLTMIAQTMLPEAFHQGGALTGIATLLGFLSAVFVKSLGLH